jgi:hypothetical protein
MTQQHRASRAQVRAQQAPLLAQQSDLGRSRCSLLVRFQRVWDSNLISRGGHAPVCKQPTNGMCLVIVVANFAHPDYFGSNTVAAEI